MRRETRTVRALRCSYAGLVWIMLRGFLEVEEPRRDALKAASLLCTHPVTVGVTCEGMRMVGWRLCQDFLTRALRPSTQTFRLTSPKLETSSTMLALRRLRPRISLSHPLAKACKPRSLYVASPLLPLGRSVHSVLRPSCLPTQSRPRPRTTSRLLVIPRNLPQSDSPVPATAIVPSRYSGAYILAASRLLSHLPPS